MSFLAGDLADLGKYTEITSTNVVEFVEKFVETLTYKLTSSSGQGKRKETSVKNALAADQLLRFFVDSRYKNEDVDHARIKAIVSSVDVNIRNAPEFLGICSSLYSIDSIMSTLAHAQTSEQATQQFISGGQIGQAPDEETFKILHPGKTLVALHHADRELADALFELFSYEKLPAQLRKVASDQRSSHADWSGIDLLERIFHDIDPYKTLNTLVENKFHAVQYEGSGKMSDFLGTKRKLFERLPKDSQVRLNGGKPLEDCVRKQFSMNGKELTSTTKVRYTGLTSSVIALILASPNAGVHVKGACKEILSKGNTDPQELDYTKVYSSLMVFDKLDEETTPRLLTVHNLKRKDVRTLKCYNCGKGGHRYWECKTTLKPEFQRKVHAFKEYQAARKEPRVKKKAKKDDSNQEE